MFDNASDRTLRNIKRASYLIILGLTYYVGMNFYKDMPMESIDIVSAQYLGKPYIDCPLGEGSNGTIDKNPRIRYDAFNSKTFLETTLAERMAKTRFLTEYYLNKIRYMTRNKNFVSRAHFITSDWLPHNSNILKPYKLPGEIHSEIIINRSRWFYKIKNFVSNEMPKRGQIDYLPIEKIDISLIPLNSVIFVVRDFSDKKEELGTNMLVSDMGFAIFKPNYLYFRHVNPNIKFLLDEPLDEYFRELKKRDPNVQGISIYTLVH